MFDGGVLLRKFHVYVVYYRNTTCIFISFWELDIDVWRLDAWIRDAWRRREINWTRATAAWPACQSPKYLNTLFSFFFFFLRFSPLFRRESYICLCFCPFSLSLSLSLCLCPLMIFNSFHHKLSEYVWL